MADNGGRIVRVYRATCNQCGMVRESQSDQRESEFKKALHKVLWAYILGEGWLCTNCQQKYQENYLAQILKPVDS